MKATSRACYFLGAASFVFGQSPDSAEFFEKKIRPVFATKCVGCHNQKVSSGGLDLSSVNAIARGAKTGPLVSKADPTHSRILEVTSYQAPMKMPPDGKLSESVLADLRAWVMAGAKLPEYQQATANTAAFFEERIRPIFSTSCVPCHNESLKTAGLDLSSPDAIAKGGRRGAIVSKDNPDQSLILRVTSYKEKVKMPPGFPLPESAVEDLRAWARAGAPMPEYQPSSKPDIALTTKRWDSKRISHWAFQPVKTYALPPVRNVGWVKSPVDRFILARLEQKNLEEPKPADKLTLLRRAKYDLLGLPPTEQEMREFTSDTSPDAFAKLIDRFLASPQYGEKWGRHWLDVARFAESGGVDENEAYPDAWRYREYVIDAFNRDLPFNQFMREQIAGDMLPSLDGSPLNSRGIVALGFLALGPKANVELDKVKTVYDTVDEQIDTTSKAFLGLTISCARCHDHKFDPISTADYYSLASIFASTRSFMHLNKRFSPAYQHPMAGAEAYELYQKAQRGLTVRKAELQAIIETETWKYISTQLAPQLPAYLVASWKTIHEKADPNQLASAAGIDSDILKSFIKYLTPNGAFRLHLKEFEQADKSTIERIAQDYYERFQKTGERYLALMLEWKAEADAARSGQGPVPDAEFRFERTSFSDPRERFFLEVVVPQKLFDERNGDDGPFVIPDAQQVKHFPAEVQERIARLTKDLEAETKLAPPKPPVANSVAEGAIVNQKIFVRGSHSSPGVAVPKAVPEILRIGHNGVPNGGSGRKQLAEWLVDPKNPLTPRVIANRLWQWHFGEGLVRTPNNFGLMGELPTHPELLDYLATRIVDDGWSLKKMHRLIMLSSVYQSSSEITRPMWQEDPGNRLWSRFNRRRISVEEMRDTWLQLTGTLDLRMGSIFDQVGAPATGRRMRPVPGAPGPFETSKRRTVYLPVSRNALPNAMVVNDFVDSTMSAGERPETIVAPQALYLMNNGYVADQAKQFALKLTEEAGLGDEQRVRRAIRMAWTREADQEVVDLVLKHLASFPADKKPSAWESFGRMLFLSNNFHYID